MILTIERPSLRQTRHLAYIEDIRYVRGETNFVVDALSRPSVSAIGSASVINYRELSKDQALDAEFTRFRHSTSSTLFDNNLTCRRDTLDRTSQPNFENKFLRAFTDWDTHHIELLSPLLIPDLFGTAWRCKLVPFLFKVISKSN